MVRRIHLLKSGGVNPKEAYRRVFQTPGDGAEALSYDEFLKLYHGPSGGPKETPE
jgi:hypothetical protein